MLNNTTHRLALITTTLVLVAGVLSACTWVPKTPNSQAVRIIPSDRIMGCRLVGSVTTYTADRVSIVNRSAKKVQEELDTLAKNDAVTQGGDTLVRTSNVVDGKQSFDIYRCLN